jgi:hypothetical protein
MQNADTRAIKLNSYSLGTILQQNVNNVQLLPQKANRGSSAQNNYQPEKISFVYTLHRMFVNTTDTSAMHGLCHIQQNGYTNKQDHYFPLFVKCTYKLDNLQVGAHSLDWSTLVTVLLFNNFSRCRCF